MEIEPLVFEEGMLTLIAINTFFVWFLICFGIELSNVLTPDVNGGPSDTAFFIRFESVIDLGDQPSIDNVE